MTEKQQSTITNRWQRHQSPAYMVLALLAGLALAVGHHCFYASYNDHRVDASDLNQAWIVRIGTGMAFLVKTFLVVSATIAFTQHQWLITRSKPFKVRQIDIISSILSNPLGFFQTRSWFRLPILLLAAIITWLLPIAAIITPATIVVVANKEVTNQLSTPSQLYYDPSKYGNLRTIARTDYIGPSPELLRNAFSSAFTGAITQIPSAFANETYNLDFIGPALSCDLANATVINQTANAYQQQYLGGIGEQYHYLAWVPNRYTDFDLLNANDTTYLDTVSSDSAHLYIVPNTSVVGPVRVSDFVLNPDGPYGYDDLLDCTLHNASYHAFLNFSYPTQTVEITSRTLLNSVPASTDISAWYSTTTGIGIEIGDFQQQVQRICYQAVMECLGRILVGYEWLMDGVTVTQMTSWSLMLIDWTDREAAGRGVEELFQNITFSLLSSEDLTMNKTIADRNKLPVEVYSTYNVYKYHAKDLWLAYGIAIGSTVLCASIGFYAIWRNRGASYQNVFSTCVRTAYQKQSLQDLIDHFDTGCEPLPEKLAEAEIVLAEKEG